MKRLVRSTKTGIFCTQCDKSIPVNTSRIIAGGMHSHYECLNKLKLKERNKMNIKFSKVSNKNLIVNVTVTALICLFGSIIVNALGLGEYGYLCVGLVAASIEIELK